MKLLELEIINIRGVKQLHLKPQGNNLVVWGPNGTGKSGVIDAIDFLLTGKVTRLTGQGTKVLSLKKHGPHIDTKPEDAVVRAVISIPNIEEPIEIKRCMADPTYLEVDNKYKGILAPILNLAVRGQNILTRREILRYVTSEPGTRAEQIQTLLNVIEIENIRKNFVKIANNALKDRNHAQYTLEQAKSGVNATLQQSHFDSNLIIEFINQNRAILKGNDISQIDSFKLKEGIVSPKILTNKEQPNMTLLERDISNLLTIQSVELQNQLLAADTIIREIAIKLKIDPQLSRTLKSQQLIELGLKILNDNKTSSCPLCNKDWEIQVLQEYLKTRLTFADLAATFYEQIDNSLKIISETANVILSSLNKVLAVIITITEFNSYYEEFKEWQGRINEYMSLLNAPIEDYSNIQFTSNEVKKLFTNSETFKTLEELKLAIKAMFPESSPEQNAWDTLTRLEENLKAVEISETTLANTTLFLNRANHLQIEFEKSRDKILGELYDAIRDRFVTLYKQLHGDDERDFSAKLEHQKASLNLEVNFYGRGSYPPHALHSEGHQDSMGLCLFLSLAEYLTQDLIDVILLDDVVMSVDAEHRRSLCSVLMAAFPNKQFVITTHDTTWANQLKTAGVVVSKNSVEFYNWHLDTGPHVNYEIDLWNEIEKATNSNDIPNAAAKLRRGAEAFFENMCDSLEASVTYRQNHRWELYSFLAPTVEKYKKLLKEAKSAAQSWGNTEVIESIKTFESMVTQVFTRTNAELWGVNSSVHYNSWNNFTKNDFIPVVEAFKDLFNLFICQNCKTTIRLVTKGFRNESVKCSCGSFSLNLTSKQKENKSFTV